MSGGHPVIKTKKLGALGLGSLPMAAAQRGECLMTELEILNVQANSNQATGTIFPTMIKAFRRGDAPYQASIGRGW